MNFNRLQWITSFVVIDLVIAFICESVSEVQHQEIKQNLMQINSMITTTEEQKTSEMINLETKVYLQRMIKHLQNEVRQQQHH